MGKFLTKNCKHYYIYTCVKIKLKLHYYDSKRNLRSIIITYTKLKSRLYKTYLILFTKYIFSLFLTIPEF